MVINLKSFRFSRISTRHRRISVACFIMRLSRKAFLDFVAGASALTILSWSAFIRSALALDYPTRPVHIIVGFPAGTSSDITARLVAQRLSEQLGQQFVVENRTGAGTNVAAESVLHATADGYTLLWVTQTNAINATLYDTLNFNFSHDVQPVAGILRVPAVMMVNPSVPASTVPEFIAYAKANPGKINMSSPGIGSINHVAGELFNMMAGVKLAHISLSQQPVSRSVERRGANHLQPAAVLA